jgi:dTDP-4-amino-4,6-dideoxygalactose transaminase
MSKSVDSLIEDKGGVAYWDYLHEYRGNREEYLAIADKVFDSGRLILGEQVASFERNFSEYCGSRFGVGVNSCTDALFLALKALDIGAGDEVITVSNTAVPTVAAIRATGATPVFVDVEEDTSLMDISKVEAAISPRCRCMIPVHLFGMAVDMKPLLEIALRNNLRIVEDCAQAAGATYQGRRVGSFGEMGAFSFYPTKVLGAFGDGGMIVTSNAPFDKRLRRLRFYGIDDNYHSEEEGYNSRLDEIQAALLDFRLKKLDSEVNRRREIAAAYDSALAGTGDIALPVERDGRRHQYYLYTIRTSRRDSLMAHLADLGIGTRINYPTPVHLMRGYSFLGYRKGDLPVTERLAEEILSLPMYPHLPDSAVGRVVEAVRSFF